MLTWGKNADGQLGYATSEPASFAPRVVAELLGTQVAQVAAGRRATFFVAADDRVYACGHKSACAGIGAGPVPTLIEVRDSLLAVRACVRA